MSKLPRRPLHCERVLSDYDRGTEKGEIMNMANGFEIRVPLEMGHRDGPETTKYQPHYWITNELFFSELQV